MAEEVQRAISFIKDVPGVSNSFASSSFATRFRNRWEADQDLELGVTTLLINDEIAVVTLPSLGVGVELEWAVSSGKPVVLMSEKESKVSRAILGLPGVVYHIEFEGIEDAQRKLQQVLKQL